MGELIHFPRIATQEDDTLRLLRPAQLYYMSNGGEPLTEQVLPDEPDSPAVPFSGLSRRLEKQADFLKMSESDGHPIIVDTRNFLTEEKSTNDLGAVMAGSLPAVMYLSNKFGQPLMETLDDLTEQFGYDKYPEDYKELKKFWKNAYMFGTGMFHLEQLTEWMEPSEIDHYSVRQDMNCAMNNLQQNPVAFLNCLDAAVFTDNDMDQSLMFYVGTSQRTFNDVSDANRQALKVLASQHIAERPFATWYLLNTALNRHKSPMPLRPLLQTIEDVQVGMQKTRYVEGVTPLLNRMNDVVKSVVRRKWNSFGAVPHDFNPLGTDGHIDGALTFNDTRLATIVKRPEGRSREHERELEKVRSNLNAMTAQLIKYASYPR